MATIKWKNSIEDAREKKLYELSRKCNETILGRFSHTIGEETYFFSNDSEAQANFDKAFRTFENGWMTEIPWTAYDPEGNVVRVPITLDTFPALYMAHLAHIQDNISKFRDFLMPLVEGAYQEKSVAQIEAVTWDQIPTPNALSI